MTTYAEYVKAQRHNQSVAAFMIGVDAWIVARSPTLTYEGLWNSMIDFYVG